jgi:hypothetical protein
MPIPFVPGPAAPLSTLLTDLRTVRSESQPCLPDQAAALLTESGFTQAAVQLCRARNPSIHSTHSTHPPTGRTQAGTLSLHPTRPP